jgi:hypothetical protein
MKMAEIKFVIDVGGYTALNEMGEMVIKRRIENVEIR